MSESKEKIDEVIRKYLDGEISLTLACRLLNMNVIEFVNYLKSKGIKPFKAEEEDIKP
jgi:Uncharacterised protein family (UPF0175).